MQEPLLSVCVITYNHSQYIRQCLDSLLMQRLSARWQIIVADDHSTDGTREILQEYKEKHPDLIHLILQKKNVGAEQNWLDLISYPKSKYVLYTEGDDYLLDPSKLQKQLDFLDTHTDFSMVFHPVKVTYEGGVRPNEIFPTPLQRYNKRTLGPKELLKSNFIQTNSVMYRWRFAKESVRKIFPAGVIPGDWYLHLLHAQVGKIGFLDSVMSVYRRHPKGVWWESHQDIDAIWKKYGDKHFRLYTETLKLYDDSPELLEPVYDNLAKLLVNLVVVDDLAASRTKELLQQHPEVQLPVLLSQSRLSKAKDQEIQKLSQRIIELKAAEVELERQRGEVKRLEQETDNYHATVEWKLRRGLAKILGKS